MFGRCNRSITFEPMVNYTYETTGLKPHTCPVCEGRGTVPCGFYSHQEHFTSSSTSPETCKTCNGGGILWG